MCDFRYLPANQQRANDREGQALRKSELAEKLADWGHVAVSVDCL